MTVENPEFKPNLREKHKMKMPGFTAEASLFNGDMRYQTTTVAAVYGEFIQPAAISDIYTLLSDLFTMKTKFWPICYPKCLLHNPISDRCVIWGCL
jgi:hypothetical protein